MWNHKGVNPRISEIVEFTSDLYYERGTLEYFDCNLRAEKNAKKWGWIDKNKILLKLVSL